MLMQAALIQRGFTVTILNDKSNSVKTPLRQMPCTLCLTHIPSTAFNLAYPALLTGS